MGILDKPSYTKPQGGIPKTDLATAVQSSLTGADSAVSYLGDKLLPTPWVLLPRILPLVRLIPNFGISTAGDYISTGYPQTATSNEAVRDTTMPVIDWQPGINYPQGAVRSRFNKILVCTTAGLSGASFSPNSGNTPQADNTCAWLYLRDDFRRWNTSLSFSQGTYIFNGSAALYAAVVGGTSAATGTGPSANSTSISDNTITWCRIQQQWIDSVNGNDSNDGLSPATPKATLPQSPVANTHYWVAAGSSFYWPSSSTLPAFSATKTYNSVTVYDRTTWNEITSQVNPYLTALEGKWVPNTDLASKYFEIYSDGQAFTNTTFPAGGNGQCFAGNAQNTWFILRGAYIHGFASSAVRSVGPNAGAFLVSDCVFANNSLLQNNDTTNAVVMGFAVRYESSVSTTTTFPHLLQRNFILSTGEDAIWLDSNPQAMDCRIYDNAIVHRPTTIGSSHHVDAIQINRYPGNLRIRRNIIEHDLSYVNNSDGSAPIGAALIQDNTGTTAAETMEVTDNVFVSTQLVTNIQNVGTGTGFQRNLFGIVHPPAGHGKRSPVAFIHAGNASWTLTDCVNVLDTAGGRGDRRYFGILPTVVTTKELYL